jgi:hypothetical protein
MKIKLKIEVEVDNEDHAKVALDNVLESTKDCILVTGGNIYAGGPVYAGGRLVGSYDLDLIRRK